MQERKTIHLKALEGGKEEHMKEHTFSLYKRETRDKKKKENLDHHLKASHVAHDRDCANSRVSKTMNLACHHIS